MKGTPFANRRRLVSIRKGHLSLHPSCLHSTKSRQDGGRKQPFDLCYTFGCHTFPDAPLLISSDWLRAIMIISSCNQLVLQITFILLGKFLNQTSKFLYSCDFRGFNGLLVKLILQSGDIATTVSFSSKASIKFLVMNARSLKSIHYSQGVVNSARYNLHCFQDLVYTEDLNIVLVTETWLHRDVESSELLYSGYSIYRNDR